MIPTSVLVHLATLGLSVEQAEKVSSMLSEVEAATRNEAEAGLQKSREKARARFQKWKDKQPENVSKRCETLRNADNGSRAGDARGLDNLQTKNQAGVEEKKDTSPPARSSRGTRIPDDFQPDIEAAVSEGMQRADAQREARSFVDYWRSKPGKDGLKLDWPATWRVWFRRSIRSHPALRPQATAPPSHMDRVNAYLDEIQGKTNHDASTGPTINGSYSRADRGGAPTVVQFDAIAARVRS